MHFEKYRGTVRYLYHYTAKENVENILAEKCIRTGRNRFCFFTGSADTARLLFSELMQKPIDYIDDDLHVARRIPQDPDDYVLLRIRVADDSSFYRFVVDTDQFNPYDYSILHDGTLKFSRATVLSLTPDKKAEAGKANVLRATLGRYRKAFAAGFAAALIGINSLSSYAFSAPSGTWSDTGNYVTDWYDETSNAFQLDHAEQLAGLVSLVNQGHDFEGKSVNLRGDMDLSACNWSTIPSSFKGTVEGLDRVVLTLFSSEIPFAENMERVKNIEFRYANEPSTSVTYSVDPTYTVTIPATVRLGETATVSAENVVLEKGKQVTVKLTATDGENNAFTLKTQEGAVIAYTVADESKTYAVSDTVLSVDPVTADRGTKELRFSAAEAAKYAGSYTGTVTFTVSVQSVQE